MEVRAISQTRAGAGPEREAADFVPPRLAARALGRSLVRGLDGQLRRAERIIEFSSDPRCVLRIAPAAARGRVRLSDGIELRPGDPVLELHFWNEHLPQVGPDGPAIGWGARFRDDVIHSLRLLADRLERLPEVAEARAIHGRMALSSRPETQRRFAGHLGFEVIERADTSLGRRTHDALENLWLAALGWTFNPERTRPPRMARARSELWMSPAKLRERYGKGRASGG